MTALVLARLLGIVVVVALGYLAARLGALGGDQAATVLSSTAFNVFVPALLFQTTAQVDLAALPWRSLMAFFVPTLVLLVAVYLLARLRPAPGDGPVAPAVRAISVTFGNTVQVGIPVILALYGAEGLRLHVAIVSVHALTILTVVTALAEVDLARHHAAISPQEQSRVLLTLATTVRNTVIHPVVLPVLAGLVWNLTGLGLASGVNDLLTMLGQAVVPLCLVLIGVSLSRYGSREALGSATLLAAAKLLVLPAVVFLVARGGLGITGIPLAVVVLAAALPVGSNALLFAQRYRTLEGEATTAIVLSTPAYALTLPVWLAVLAASA